MIPAPGVFVVGLILIFGVVWDAFEAIILPGGYAALPLNQVFYKTSWRLWTLGAALVPSRRLRKPCLVSMSDLVF